MTKTTWYIIGVIAVILIIIYLIYNSKKSTVSNHTECAVELFIRSAANNGKSATYVYKELYHKEPIRGISALSYCPNQQ